MKILVTGTTGGIGGAVKSAALAAGHEVTEVNRGDFKALSADRIGSGIEALVFATGTCPVLPLTALADEAFAETVAVNCGLFIRLMRFVVRERLYAPSGMRAVAVSSVSAVEGWPGGAAYCGSKGALSAVCRALDAELGPRGISVAALEPRHVRTRMFDACAGRMGVDPSLARDPADFALEVLSAVRADTGAIKSPDMNPTGD